MTLGEFFTSGLILGQNRQTLGNNCCRSIVTNFLMNLEHYVTKYRAALYQIDLLYFETSGNTGHDCATTDRARLPPDV